MESNVFVRDQKGKQREGLEWEEQIRSEGLGHKMKKLRRCFRFEAVKMAWMCMLVPRHCLQRVNSAQVNHDRNGCTPLASNKASIDFLELG